jgi:serine/threonine protein kinase/Flp pilus assembly protein TadD
MGTVYLARDARLGRHVALKVLNPEDMASGERRARFTREARAAAAIRHQNVATIYEVDETENGEPFIVMEYCQGETLAQRMRRHPIDAVEFITIARQIAAGVAAAHDNGVVHRDIKSANIMLEPDGLVKILDFGLAKLTPREYMTPGDKPSFESTSGHFFGTIHYISPEQARGGAADARSDLFSLGVLFFQMATGQLPFNGDAPLLILERIRDSEPDPFVPHDPTFPSSAARIISRLLQKDPLERYQNAGELLHDLDEIDTPTQRVPSATSRSRLGRTRPRPRMRNVIIATIALMLAGSGVYLIRSRDARPAALQQTGEVTPIRSMAVLPLDNIANNARDEFLSVGLADALVTKLQQIPSLQVRPTSAVMEFKNRKIDPKTASEKLQVDSVLEGHFLAAGDLVRVTLQLTDTRTGYNVWADTIDGRRDNLLKLIDDVSARTVNGLNERVGVGQVAKQSSEPRSSNPAAYEQYLRARSLNGSLVPAEFQAHTKALERAIELDPNFAAAYADLAISLSLGSVRSLTPPDAIQKAEGYARQAVRLDPNLPQAHLALGRVFVRYPGRFRESVREILAALRLNANDTVALHSMTTYFISTGDMQKAQCIGDRLVRLDPGSNEAKTRGYWAINAVDPEGAIRNAAYALASRDTELTGHDMRGVAFVMLGNLAEAENEAREAEALVPSHYIGKSIRAMIAAANGDLPRTEALIRSFEEDANRNHWAALRIAMCYAKLGKREKALVWMKKAVDLGNHSWYALVKNPWLHDLQGDPEFQQILSRVKSDLDDVRDDVVGVYQLLCE